MYYTEAGVRAEPESTLAFAKDLLAEVSLMSSSTEQFLALCPKAPGSESTLDITSMSIDDIDAFYGFAIDNTSSNPLIVRVQALQLAIEAAKVRRGTSALPPSDFDPNELRVEFLSWPRTRVGKSKNILQGPNGEDVALPTENMSQALMTQAGIDIETIFSPENVPTEAYMFLMSLISKPHLPHRLINNDKTIHAVDLALDVNCVCGNQLFSIDGQQEKALHRDSEEAIEFFGHDDPIIREYSHTLLLLYINSMYLKQIFPNNYGIALQRGAHSLVMNSIYAANNHLKNNKKTQTKIPLRGQPSGEGLNLELKGDEPLDVLKKLSTAIMQLTKIASSENVIATPVVEYDDYQMFRLWDENGNGNASVYIRPFGAHDYDDYLEYGRPREGVEASIDFTIDTSLAAGDLFNVSKARRRKKDDRISIRLDREGVKPAERGAASVRRDPTSEQGTLSLDIGSVKGDDKWLSSKVGRLLAWGNILRSEELGLDAELNHSVHYFDEKDGMADVFAESATELIEHFKSRQPTTAKLESVIANNPDLAELH
jgi:hypothetical protein